MSNSPSWNPEGGPPRPGPPPYGPPAPRPQRPSGTEWLLPVFFLASIVMTAVFTVGTNLGLEALRGWALTAFITAGGLGVAVVLSRPDQALPDRTRWTLQAIRVIAGLVVGALVAGIAFFVYMVVQALRDPNTE